MPVADPEKVRRRKEESFPEDDFNQSYEFDADEDFRARQEDANMEEMEAGKSSRQKKRELEERFGTKKAKATQQNLNNSNQHNTLHTFDMNNSEESLGVENLNASQASFGSGDSTKPKKRKKKKKKKKQVAGSSDDGMDPQDEAFNRSNEGSLNSAGGKRVVKMRDTDRLIRKSAAQTQRQDSLRPSSTGNIQRQNPNRPNMAGKRQNSAPTGPHGGALVVRPEPRGRSAMPRANTAKPGTMARQRSKSKNRSNSLDPSGHQHRSDGNLNYHHSSQRRARSQSTDRSKSKGMMLRQQSMPGGSMGGQPPPPPRRTKSMSRPPQTMPGAGGRPMFARSASSNSMASRGSTLSRGNSTVITQNGKKVYLVPMSRKEAEELRRNPSRLSQGHPYGKHMLRRKFEVEETPPRSLVLIWAIVIAELVFDLGTTIIAFRALLEDSECCGHAINIGPIPMSVTFPFFLLVVAELAFLCRAVILTLWPSMLTKREEDIELEDLERKRHRSFCMNYLCCCLKWNARMVLKILNFLVLLNPFFGCVIAWVLLYQSDKTEAFIVLGLEGGSIILHFVSVYLEGGLDTCCGVLFHCIPVLPFLASVTMVLVYLQYGGVCYIVERANFFYWGCEVCDNGWPPVNGTCTLNGTNITVPISNSIFDVNLDVSPNDINAIRDELLATTEQGQYCEDEHPGGPPGNFCFYSY